MTVKYVGQDVLGKTNRILASGKGSYVADIRLPGMCHLAVLRSPYAHARIRAIRTATADAMPAVIATVVGEAIRHETEAIPNSQSSAG